MELLCIIFWLDIGSSIVSLEVEELDVRVWGLEGRMGSRWEGRLEGESGAFVNLLRDILNARQCKCICWFGDVEV